MGTPSAGEIVTVHFPFSDLSSSKLRPAIVLADAGRGDWVLCQLTSNPYSDPNAGQIEEGDFASGSLSRISYARPGKIFTANEGLIITQIGKLKTAAFHHVANAVIRLLQSHLATE